MKYILSLIVIPFFAFSLLAQPAEESGGLDFLDDSDEALGAALNKAEKAASEFLARKKDEWNEKRITDRFGAFASAAIGESPSSPNYIKAKSIAYEAAMLNLKGDIANEMALEIENEMSLSYGKPAEAARQKQQLQDIQNRSPMEVGMLDKAKLLIHDELDNQLDKRGIKPGTPAAQNFVKAELERRMTSTVKTIAQAEMGSIYTAKTIEDGNNIAVVGIYSDKMKQLQSAILGKGEAPKLSPNPGRPTLSSWLQSLSKGALYGSHGIQIKPDKFGDLNLLAYSQWPASSTSSLAVKFATKEAGMQCLSYMRSFAGEIVKNESGRELTSKLEEYGQLDGVVQKLEVGSTFDQNIKSRAEKLSFPGIKTLHTWQTLDKRSGTVICGVVQGWNISGAEKALASKREFESVGGSSGGAGLTGNSVNSSVNQPQKSKGYDPTKSSGSKIVESLESEDF
jgi:hypothetical protein